MQLVYTLLTGAEQVASASPPAIIILNSAHVVNAAVNVKWALGWLHHARMHACPGLAVHMLPAFNRITNCMSEME